MAQYTMYGGMSHLWRALLGTVRTVDWRYIPLIDDALIPLCVATSFKLHRITVHLSWLQPPAAAAATAIIVRAWMQAGVQVAAPGLLRWLRLLG